MPTNQSPEFDDRFVPVHSPTARFVTIEGEAVVLDEHGRVYRLNPEGAILWACFDGTGTLAEIAQDVSDELGIPYARVLDDVVDLARRLGAAGLLTNVGPSPDASEPAHTLETSGQGDRRFLPEPPNT